MSGGVNKIRCRNYLTRPCSRWSWTEDYSCGRCQAEGWPLRGPSNYSTENNSASIQCKHSSQNLMSSKSPAEMDVKPPENGSDTPPALCDMHEQAQHEADSGSPTN